MDFTLKNTQNNISMAQKLKYICMRILFIKIQYFLQYPQIQKQIQIFIIKQIMSDQIYDLNRKLRYINKYQDNLFAIKYVLQSDFDNQNTRPGQKNLLPALPKKKFQSANSQSDKKPSYQQPQQREVNTNAKQKIKRRNERMKKKLQFGKQQMQIFKSFKPGTNLKDYNLGNNFHRQKDKGNKKNRGTKKNRQNKIFNTQSQDQLQSGSFSNLQLPDQQPQIRKKISKSIDRSNKPRNQQKVQKGNKMQKFYQQKNNAKQIYKPYLNRQDIQVSRDLKQNKYFRGTVHFNQRVKNYAKIFSKQIQGDLIVEGLYKNRCIHGDQVYFQVLQNNQSENEKQKDTMKQNIRCKVVYILPWQTKQKRKIVGKVEFTKKNNTFYLLPINKRIVSFDIKFSDISQETLKKKNQKYFIAQFTEWRTTDEFPTCKILSQFGAIGEIQAETQALLINNGVQDKQYDEQTIQKGLQKFLKNADERGQYKISQQQIKKRSDLRNQRIFTIDPLTAKDFDDALSIVQFGTSQNGQKVYQIGVHIADTSFFVQEGGLIDERAQQTTTSVYLVHKVLPMLPRVLCQTMCSLNPGLQRLTISVWFKITSSGVVLPGSRYDRSVIKSKARFTYQQAQKIIKKEVKSQQQIQLGFGCVKKQQFGQIAQDLIIMNDLAMKVRNARIKGGSLIFQTPKKSFKLDQNFMPQSISVNKRFQANFLVQQYMLLANQKVGQILVQNVGASALLRRHKFPSDKKIQKFQQFTLKINNPIKINREVPMQQQMNQVINNPKLKQCIKDVLNYQMIFLLEQAEYFVVADTKRQQWLHYALNMPVYTHFTSPIRRYPDIMVHRELIAIINARRENKPKSQIQIPTIKRLKQLIDRCNRNKVNAKKVSSGCQKIFMCLYLKTHPVFSRAVLTDLNQYCLSICVPSYDFRTVIQFKQLKMVKPLQFGKDSSERKFVQIECQYEKGKSNNTILKQMQQIQVKLCAKQGFPIDYDVKLVFPHPQNLEAKVICQ